MFVSQLSTLSPPTLCTTFLRERNRYFDNNFRLTPESLSWLNVKRRGPKFVETCHRVAKLNKTQLSEQTLAKIKKFSEHPFETAGPGRMYTLIDCELIPTFRSPLLCNMEWLCPCTCVCFHKVFQVSEHRLCGKLYF